MRQAARLDHLNESALKDIKSLVQLDIDAVFAYEQALRHIEDPEIHARISEFKNDHERHIQDLSQVLQSNGEKPPERSKDFKGYLIEGMTRLRSVTGTEGALKAMKTNEETTNKKYENALSWELPDEIHQLIQRNREDERRHLEYIIGCLQRM